MCAASVIVGMESYELTEHKMESSCLVCSDSSGPLILFGSLWLIHCASLRTGGDSKV